MTLPHTPEEIPGHFAAAWNARDAAALAALFVEDADFVNVVGLWWHKRADIQRAHAYGLRVIFDQSSLRAGGIKVRLLGQDYAVVIAVGISRGSAIQWGSSWESAPRSWSLSRSNPAWAGKLSPRRIPM